MEKPYFSGLAIEKASHRLEAGLLIDEFLDNKWDDGCQRVSQFPELQEIVSEPGAFQALFHDPPFMGGIQFFFTLGDARATFRSYLLKCPAAFPLHENLR